MWRMAPPGQLYDQKGKQIPSKTRHQHSKTTRKTTPHMNFTIIRATAICSQKEPCHSRCPNKLGPVMICQ